MIVMDVTESLKKIDEGKNAAPDYSAKLCRRQAAALLRCNGRRLSLIWACLGIVGLLACGSLACIYMQNAAIGLMDYLAVGELWVGLFAWLTNMLIAAVLFFLILPIVTGIIPFSVTVIDGHPDVSLLFGAFADETAYGHALALLWSRLWRVAAGAAVAMGIVGALSLMFPEEEALPGWAIFLFCVIVVIILLLTVLVSGSTFLLPYLAAVYPQKTLQEDRRISRVALSGHFFEIFFFRVFFLAASCLSLLTVGIAFVVCVLPLWLAAYVIAARALLSKIDV